MTRDDRHRLPGLDKYRLPGLDGHRHPRLDGYRLSGLDGHRLPGLDGHRLPGLDGYRLPGLDPGSIYFPSQKWIPGQARHDGCITGVTAVSIALLLSCSAQVADDALGAVWIAGFADITAMQDQPVVGIEQVLLRYAFE